MTSNGYAIVHSSLQDISIETVYCYKYITITIKLYPRVKCVKIVYR